MWAVGDRRSGSGVRAGARALRAAGIAALALAFGCAERTPPTAGEAPSNATETRIAPAPLPPRAPRAAASSLRPRTPLRAPVAMPGGGTRIDMRGGGRHVRALERQPDGTLKQVCLDAPEMVSPSGGSR
jgi:hypothetical protein